MFVDNLKENVATSVEEVMAEMKKAEGLSPLKVRDNPACCFAVLFQVPMARFLDKK